MKRAIFEERGRIDAATTIDDFMKALFPLFDVYGITKTGGGFDCFRDFTLGDPHGARIEYRYFGGYTDPYSGGSTAETLKSFELVNRQTNAPSALRITIEDVAWAQTEINLRFEGEDDEIEVLRQATVPILKKCMWKYKNP